MSKFLFVVEGEKGEGKVIKKFYDTIKEDDYIEGISLANYFGEYDVKYAYEYLVVDADMKDKDGGLVKDELLIKLNSLVQKMDGTKLLVNAPQLEAISDESDTYTYVKGQKYKTHINTQFWPGALAHFEKNISSVLKMNVEKYKNIE